MRQEFPTKVKLAAFERAKGRCENCTALLLGRCEYDHRVPDAIGGAATLENCSVLCRACHALKTAGSDVPAIAKSKRVRARHANARGTSPRGFRRPPKGYNAWTRRIELTDDEVDDVVRAAKFDGL